MAVSMKVHQKLKQCPMLVLHITKRLVEQFKKIFTNSFFSLSFSEILKGEPLRLFLL